MMADLEEILLFLTPVLVSLRYDENIEATMRAYTAANDTIVGTSEVLGVDAALPRLLKLYLDQAIADGYGEQEIPAISELMAPSDT